MSANPPKADAWPPFKRVRFVLVRREPWTALPVQGLVLDWRKTGPNHQALVAYVDEALHPKRIITEWMPAEKLTPIRADPNVIDYGRSPWDRRRR
ncbi:MAG: hypothetical protein ABIN55_03485 [Aeromicrobium sp.]